MKIEKLERTVIIADKDKILTDGNNYGKIFALSSDRKIEEFTEISKEEYEEILKENTEETA